MIYIFDDRARRRELYSKTLNRYSALIKPDILNLIDTGNFDESLIEKYGDAYLIILHTSYRIKGGEIKSEEIRDYFLRNGLHVVTFSGGAEMNDVSHKEKGTLYNMNAERMYGNLEIFLKDYELKGEPNIELLLWGEQYRLNQLLSFQWILGIQFININLDEPITEDEADNLIDLIENELASEGLTDFKDRIETYIETGLSESITHYQLLDFVSHLIREYIR